MVDRGKIELTDSGWRRCKTEKPTKKKAKRESEKMGRMKDLGITIPGDHHPGTRRSFLVHIEVHEIDKHGLHGLMEVQDGDEVYKDSVCNFVVSKGAITLKGKRAKKVGKVVGALILRQVALQLSSAKVKNLGWLLPGTSMCLDPMSLLVRYD